MPDAKGRIQKGEHLSPATEFKPGQHWRKRKPYWDREWLREKYEDKQRSAADIASEFGVTENAILFWLHKHSIPRRTMSGVRAIKHWGVTGEENPMYGRRGSDNPNWKGGITPDRQALYSSETWAQAVSFVWRRDMAGCRRCSMIQRRGQQYHIHHCVPFEHVEYRTNANFLILVCKPCHSWIHSKKNTESEWLLTPEQASGMTQVGQ